MSRDLTTGNLVKTIENAHVQRVASIALSEKFLYSAGFDNLAKEWSRETWTSTRSFSGLHHPVYYYSNHLH